MASRILGVMPLMVNPERYYRNRFIMPILFLLLALLVWLVRMMEFRLDDSFITYRYAQNVARGLGLVYNPGDVVLSTTAPLYAVVLAILSFVVPDFHILGGLLGSISIGLGGWLVTSLLPPRMPTVLRLWAGLVYVMSSVLWLTLGMETALWIMLVLTALLLAQRQHWRWAGLVIGLATLTRPDAALPGVLLGVIALGTTLNQFNTRLRWWDPILEYGVAVAAPVIIFSLWAWATYGSPLPETLNAKSAQATLGITGFGPFVTTWDGALLIAQGLLSQSSLYITFALLALFGLSSKLTPFSILTVVWGTLHLIAYIGLAVAPYRWYYAPLLPAIVVLMAHGLDSIDMRLRLRKMRAGRVIVAAIAVFPLIAQFESFELIGQQIKEGGQTQSMLPIVDWTAYQLVGDWLRTETSPDSTIGVAEVGQVGFYAERWMTDYLGLLQPDVAEMLERGDLYSWLTGYAPDYLVFQRFRGAPLVLYNYLIGDDPWFRGCYREAAEFDDPRYPYGPVTIFRRTTRDKALLPQSAQVDYGGLRLVGLATDGYDLTTGVAPVRVRLDWEVTGPIPPELHIAVKGLEMPTIPSFDGDYRAFNWRGAFSTWHGFVLPQATSSGGYPIEVSVGPAGGPYISHIVGWLDVSYPKIEAPPDGHVFAHEGNALLRLTAIQMNLTRALTLDMIWRAESDIAADYSYFVHVTPAESDEPIAQVDGRPFNGLYPTFLWQAGELVPMQIELDELPTEEGEYDIYAGWYDASDGVRLVDEGMDNRLLLAHLIVRPGGSAIISQVIE
jgi:hypothetical protein